MALTPQDIATLSRLLDEAGAVAPAGRQSWLDALPGAHRHLVAPLRGMLDVPTLALPCALPGLAPTAGAPPGSSDADGVHAGAMIGPYRLLQKLGEGGMSEVWLAQQSDALMQRQVALKLPRVGWARGLPERMNQECRIGALLEHPHISRVYAAGTDARGRPYIAMAYIDGVAIDVWCRRQQLDTRQRLRLFLQVVKAVSHAHRLHVVHRDIKPGNILVDAQGQAHLLDFGIAKMLHGSGDDRRSTQDGVRMLSHLYAAPEQIANQPASTRSDVYTLGMTLFELLTGSRPYSDAQRLAALHGQALDDAPLASDGVGARKLRRRLQGDLDAILARALALQPERRYATADALGADIERHLAGEVIDARLNTLWYRARRFAGRRRGQLATGAAFAALLIVGAGIFAGQQRHADAQSETAVAAKAIIPGLLRRGFVPAAAVTDDAQGPSRTLAALAQVFDSHARGKPELHAELYGVAARAYIDMGVGALATELATRHLQMVNAVGASPERRCKALLLLAAALAERGRYQDAEATARDAVARSDVRTPIGLQARAVLAGLLLPNGRHAEARALIQSTEMYWPLDGRAQGVPMSQLLDAKARLLETDGRLDDAVVLWRRAIDRAVAVDGEASPLANRIRTRMAIEVLSRNRAGEALSMLQRAQQALDAGDDAARVQGARAAARFAALAFAMGHMPYERAAAALEHSRRTIADCPLGLPPQVLADVDVQQGWLALRWGDLQQARALLERSLPVVARATDGLIDRRWHASYAAALAMSLGQHDKAEPLLRKRLQLRVQAGDGTTPFAAIDWEQLSHNRLMNGDLAGAEAVIREAPEFEALQHDEQGAAYAHALQEQRVRILLARGQAAAAWAALPEPYGLAPAADRSSSLLAPYALRGEVLCAIGRGGEGLPILAASIAAIEPAVSAAAPGLARLRAVAGSCALQQGQLLQARNWAAQARRAFVQQPQASPWFKLPLARLEAGLHAAPAPRAGGAAGAAAGGNADG